MSAMTYSKALPGRSGESRVGDPAADGADRVLRTAVSGTSRSMPSMFINRQRPRNSPAVTMSATGLATCENNSAIA